MIEIANPERGGTVIRGGIGMAELVRGSGGVYIHIAISNLIAIILEVNCVIVALKRNVAAKIRINKGLAPQLVVMPVCVEEGISEDIHIVPSRSPVPVRCFTRSVHVEILIVVI